MSLFLTSDSNSSKQLSGLMQTEERAGIRANITPVLQPNSKKTITLLLGLFIGAFLPYCSYTEAAVICNRSSIMRRRIGGLG